jgi:surface protein
MTTLNDLTDVVITEPQDGQRLVREGSFWINKSIDIPEPPTPAEWVRPADWLPITEIDASEQKFIGLMAITDDDSNFAALSASGAYTVDWGDGTTTNHATATTALKLYDYSAISNDTLSERGYKQVIVTVTPQAGQNLTALNLNVRHTQAGLQAYETGWLDIGVGSPNFNASGLQIGANETVRKRMLERARIANVGNQTSMSRLFENCALLQSVFLPNTSGVTLTSSMFLNCTSLKEVPLFDTSSVTNMTTMFSGCSSLQAVPLFDTSNVTSMVSAFSSNPALRDVPLLDTSSVLDMTRMFSGCSSLQEIPMFNTANVTNMAEFLRNCTSLRSVPLLDTSKVTNMFTMFQNCHSLQSVPAFVTTAVSSAANLNSTFGACNSLTRIEAKNFNFTFSVAGCKLSAVALDEIYTNLPTVTGQTITVTGNWGTASHTPSIATAKGWTVTV